MKSLAAALVLANLLYLVAGFSHSNMVDQFKRIDDQLAREFPVGSLRDTREHIDKLKLAIHRMHEAELEKDGKMDAFRLRALENLHELVDLSDFGCPSMPAEPTVVMEIDRNLGDEQSRRSSHVAWLAEEIGSRIAFRCYDPSFSDDFRYVNGLFNRPAYGKLDELIKPVDLSQWAAFDVYMTEVKNLYYSLEANDEFALAIKDLMELSGLDKDEEVKCDDREHIILFQNQLAARAKDARFEDRPVNRVVNHYIEAHRAICDARNPPLEPELVVEEAPAHDSGLDFEACAGAPICFKCCKNSGMQIEEEITTKRQSCVCTRLP